METLELKYLENYARNLREANGDLEQLSKEERRHLAMLLRKYELEQQIEKLAEELTQLPLM